MKKIVTIIFTTNLILFGCVEKEQGANGDGSKVKLLSTYVYEDETGHIETKTFAYDKQNRLTKINHHRMEETNTFFYNNSGDLIKFTEEPRFGAATTHTFIKNGNIIHGTVEFGKDIETYTIELNNDGLIVKYTHANFWIANKYENGNLLECTFFEPNNTIFQKDTYTYDGMKSPLYHCQTPKWFLGLLLLEGYFFPVSLKNNPIQEISVEGIVTYKSDIVYTYDDDGYPITAFVKTTALGRTETANISFTYITK